MSIPVMVYHGSIPWGRIGARMGEFRLGQHRKGSVCVGSEWFGHCRRLVPVMYGRVVLGGDRLDRVIVGGVDWNAEMRLGKMRRGMVTVGGMERCD